MSIPQYPYKMKMQNKGNEDTKPPTQNVLNCAKIS